MKAQREDIKGEEGGVGAGVVEGVEWDKEDAVDTD